MTVPSNYTAYLAPLGFEKQLKAELKNIKAIYDRLFVCSGMTQTAYWAQDIWYDAKFIPITSITQAANTLKSLGRNWNNYSFTLHRRSSLIEELLPKYKGIKVLTFPVSWELISKETFGAWTLVEQNLMFLAAKTANPVYHGEYHFAENKIDPPSRAYLKLWETFTRLRLSPGTNERALEIGAAPGGWTWVLSELGCQVHALDRSPLSQSLMENPRITFLKGDAFNYTPEKSRHTYDWFFSDMICYPEKLWPYVASWLNSGKVKNFVVTLKFQGEQHYQAISSFAQVPGSTIIHLFHNKHELTWVKLQ